MPTNVLGNSSSSYDKGKKIDTSLFVQKPYLRTNCIEANIEEGINMKVNIELKIHLIQSVLEKQLQKILLIINATILVLSKTTIRILT